MFLACFLGGGKGKPILELEFNKINEVNKNVLVMSLCWIMLCTEDTNGYIRFSYGSEFVL